MTHTIGKIEGRFYKWCPGAIFYLRTRKGNRIFVHNPLLASDSRRKQGVKSRDCVTSVHSRLPMKRGSVFPDPCQYHKYLFCHVVSLVTARDISVTGSMLVREKLEC